MMSEHKEWFESYWWSPELGYKFGPPWDAWCLNGRHKTLEEAESACKKAQLKQPYIWYDVRKVTLVKKLEGTKQQQQ